VNDIAERVTELTEASHRAALLERLLDHLDSANSIQQQLLGDAEPEQCYEFHNELENLADRISDTVRET
jgi:hypothetical protein